MPLFGILYKSYLHTSYKKFVFFWILLSSEFWISGKSLLFKIGRFLRRGPARKRTNHPAQLKPQHRRPHSLKPSRMILRASSHRQQQHNITSKESIVYRLKKRPVSQIKKGQLAKSRPVSQMSGLESNHTSLRQITSQSIVLSSNHEPVRRQIVKCRASL